MGGGVIAGSVLTHLCPEQLVRLPLPALSRGEGRGEGQPPGPSAHKRRRDGPIPSDGAIRSSCARPARFWQKTESDARHDERRNAVRVLAPRIAFTRKAELWGFLEFDAETPREC